MIFFFHVENGRVNWFLPLTLFVLSSVVPAIYDFIFQGYSSWQADDQSRTGGENEAESGNEGDRSGLIAAWHEDHWFWTPASVIMGVGLPALMLFALFNLLAEARDRQWPRALMSWLEQHVTGMASLIGGLRSTLTSAGMPSRTRQDRQQSIYEQRFAKITKAVQVCPTEVFRTREELMTRSTSYLKALLSTSGAKATHAVEKSHLVDAILAAGGSTAESCGICLENYCSGSVLRRLHCSHKFHLECVDQWAFSALDYSRDPACPVCNALIAR